ncbi:MAG: hypothetical protein OEV43_01960 [Coriobacteriia bacterium]|nr:hypothetical protein [Coriobacteriia bacterium]
MRKSVLAFVIVGVLAVFSAGQILLALKAASLQRQLDSVSISEKAVEDVVDERMRYFAEFMRDGASLDTTSTEGTFWWVGYRSTQSYERQSDAYSAIEAALHEDASLGQAFHSLHEVIDGREWPDPPQAGEPYLAYPDD